MNPQTRLNAVRSGIVVLGALAFGYLTLEVGFKPFVLRAQEHQQQQEQALLKDKFPDQDT